MKTTVLLINLGTPDSPKTGDVRKYLTEFLNDNRVIDMPWLARKLLVNLIIVPFRSPKSAKLYKEVWTPQGSPLLINTQKFSDALQKKVGKDYTIEMGMRYGNPSLKDALQRIKQQQPKRIILVPLYPQYASSTTESSLEKVKSIISKWKQIPEVKIIHHFHDNSAFIDAFAQRIKQYKPQNYDHIIMSYHGLPVKHVNDMHAGNNCISMNCTSKRDENNKHCYLASCYETSRLLAEKLNLQEQDYSTCFQSRFSKNWIKPFTDKVVLDKIAEGKKRLLVISPAFVADCLETLHELGKELKNDFEFKGGEQLTLVESLNDMPLWVDAMAGMIREL